MIEIITPPYPCSFSKNHIDFKVRSNMYLTAVEEAPKMTLTFHSFPQPSDIYSIQFTNPETNEIQSVDFVVGNNTNYDQLHILPFFIVPILGPSYRDIFLSKLKEYCPINSWFHMVPVGTNSIDLIAKQPTESLQPVFTSSQGSLHIEAVIDNTIVIPNSRNGYRATASIYFEPELTSGNFEFVTTLDLVLNKVGESQIDVSSILDAAIEDSWNSYPIPGENIEIGKNNFRYYVEFHEFWNNEERLNTSKSDILNVQWGGISFDNEQIASPFELVAQKNDFLTWWPSGKRLDEKQKDWLSWMNTSFERTIKIKRIVHTPNQAVTTITYNSSLPQWHSVTFPCGIEQTDLQVLVPGQQINKWSYQVFDENDNAISLPYVFYPERVTCRKHIILFFNSFGMPETFYTSGEWNEKINVSTQTANRSAYFGTNQLFPQSFVFDSKHTISYSAVTGILSNKEALRIQPLLNSMISFLYEGGELVPIIIATENVNLVDRTEHIQRIPLEIVKANQNNRASFYEVIPTLELHEDYGIESVSIESNGLAIQNYGDLTVSDQTGTLQIVPFNSAIKAYPISPIIVPGTYIFEADIDEKKLSKSFIYQRKKISSYTHKTGFGILSVKGSQPTNSMFIDWGDGTGYSEHIYSNTLSGFIHNFGGTQGRKKVVIEKPNFNDIVELNISSIPLDPFDLTKMKNLERLVLLSAVKGGVYLSSLTKLKALYLQNSEIKRVEIGFQKELEILNISGTSMDSKELDALFIELHAYRKMYINTPQFFFQTSGYTPSSLVNSIINGTGIYTGEGLTTNYGWNILIF